MGKGQHELAINRSADDVWKVVADFGGLDAWMPGIESCELESDDVRKLSMMGMELREQLKTKDDANRVLAYSLVGMPGIDVHLATISVRPDGDGSMATWAFDAEPESMAAMMDGTYKYALDTLKNHCEA